MTKTQAGRLLTLAYFLKTQVEHRHFDMSWFTNTKGGNLHKCGSTACALGWATVVFPKVFHFCGTRIRHEKLAWIPSMKYSAEFFGVELETRGSHPKYGYDEWTHLFGSGHYLRSPKAEANVIEDFVRSKGWVYA